MRLLTLFKKTMIENFRDWKMLSLTLAFSPFFVFLMYFYLGTAVKTGKIIVVNRDLGSTDSSGAAWNAGKALIDELGKAQYPDGTKVLDIVLADGFDGIQKRLTDKTIDLAVEIPEDFSRILLDYQTGKSPAPAVMKSLGDPSNARYIAAAAYCDYLSYQFASVVTGQKGPLEIRVESIGGSKSLNDFELYVPSLLALALMMLMFTAAASIIKEKDKGTLIRLQMSSMKVHEFLISTGMAQVVIGILAVGVTYFTAWGLGYRTSGSWGAVMAVCFLSSVSVIAVSLLVAAFLRTIFDLLTVGCFPFFVLMFFSGGMIPLPPLSLFTWGGRSVNANDILPTTHTISALNKIMNFGMGLDGVAYELAAIALLTAIYFSLGLVLFNKRHLKAR